MLKGCKKQMIVLRGTGSEIFEEAHFILKSGAEKRRADARAAEMSPGFRPGEEQAMLMEANRILEENRTSHRGRPRGYYLLRYLFFFVSGLLLGGASIILALALS